MALTANRGQSKFSTRRPGPPRANQAQRDADETDGALHWIKDRIFGGPTAQDAEELKRLEHASADLKRVDAHQGDTTGEVVDEDLGTARKVAPGTLERTDVAALVTSLQDWLNDKLWERRVVVRSLFADLYDGQVLTELLEVLTGETRLPIQRGKLGIATPNSASARSEAIHQRRGRLQLEQALEWIDSLLGIKRSADLKDELKAKWTAERIWAKDVVATLHLMVALAHHFGCKYPLPDNVSVEVVTVERLKDRMRQIVTTEPVTTEEESAIRARAYRHSSAGLDPSEKDAFDKLFDQVPEKVEAVKSSLLSFVNKNLSTLPWFKPLEDVGMNFDDGILLIHLLSVLGGYFVPLYHYKTVPTGYGHRLTHLQKVGNVGLAFRLMASDGMQLQTRCLPDDVVNGDLKSTLRTLYCIFSRYKKA